MTTPFRFPIQVRFADTDAQGHVYFANYLTYCDEALAAYLRHLGCPWQAMVKDGVDMFYVSAKCDYRGSAKFEEIVEIEPRITKIGRTSVTSEFTLRGLGGGVLAVAELVSVCVDVRTREKVAVPARLSACLVD